MTDHTRTDDVLAAIDGALDWALNAGHPGAPDDDDVEDWEREAMRWSGARLDTADERREATPRPLDPQPIVMHSREGAAVHWWIHAADPDVAVGGPGQTLREEDGWREIGYTADDEIEWSIGSAAEFSHIDQAVVRRSNHSDHRMFAYRLSAARVSRTVVEDQVNLHARLQGALARAGADVAVSMREIGSTMAAAGRDGLEDLRRAVAAVQIRRPGPTGLLPDDDAAETRAERALRLRRERNTGPAAAPFARRGSTRR